MCDPATPATLAPGASVTCTGTYEADQGDIDTQGGGDNDIDNTATGASNQVDDITDSASVPVVSSPDASITKTVLSVDDDDEAPFEEVNAAGDLITYEIVYTNIGNTTLTGVDVTDPLLTGTLVCDPATPATLAPGPPSPAPAPTRAVQGDIDTQGGGDNDIDNTATGASNQVDDITDSASVPVVSSPDASITKTVLSVDDDDEAPFEVNAAGDLITYEIVYTNIGNTTLTGVDVTDPLLTGSLVCDPATPATLAPGASVTCTGTYEAVQGDIDTQGGGDNDIDNTATGASNQVDDITDSASVPVVSSPDASITKTVLSVDDDDEAPFEVNAAGDLITYEIVYTNIGNTTLTGVDVTDPLLTGTLVCDPATPATLAPGASVTCTGTYEAVQGDIDTQGGGDNDIDNTATGASNQVDDITDSASVPVVSTRMPRSRRRSCRSMTTTRLRSRSTPPAT